MTTVLLYQIETVLHLKSYIMSNSFTTEPTIFEHFVIVMHKIKCAY